MVHEIRLPFDATWTPDLWGRVRNTVKAPRQSARRPSAADLANTRLTIAMPKSPSIISICEPQDSLKQLLDDTVERLSSSPCS